MQRQKATGYPNLKKKEQQKHNKHIIHRYWCEVCESEKLVSWGLLQINV